jgi:hypothetical protein
MKRNIVMVTISCIGLLLLGCGMFPQLAGDTSETGNTFVVGKVTLPSGEGTKNVQVKLIPAAYNPVLDGPVPDSCIDTTDESGNYIFRFHGRECSHYNLQAVDIYKRTRALIFGIAAGSDTIFVPDAILENTGSIRVMLPDSVGSANGYLYIPGTTVFALLSGVSTQKTLDSVPAGTIPSVFYTANKATFPTVLRYNILVLPGDTVVVAMPYWKYSARLSLNTTSSGSGIAGDVINFPVLVRLSNGNFTFGQTLANGDDVRFTKSNGSPLAYEIEQWDPVAELAEVWVKVDTVYGDDSTQSLIMYWGNSTAADGSNSAAVFDSSSGFEGVWHLNETSGSLARDASHNGFTGNYKGGLPKNIPGPTGICQNITRPDSDYVDMGDVLNPGMKSFSIGIWLKRAALSTQQALVAKTNGNVPSSTYGYLLNFDDNNIPHLYMASGSTAWGSDGAFDMKANLVISDSTTWHFVYVVVGRSDNTLCKMYVDGIDRTGVKSGNVGSVSSIVNALNLHIGTESDNNCSYSGGIGEVTVDFTARTADWVKLCYMNQKGQDALVKW